MDFKSNVMVRIVAELAKAACNLFGEFNVYKNIDTLNNMPGTMLTESQFAQIIDQNLPGLTFLFINLKLKMNRFSSCIFTNKRLNCMKYKNETLILSLIFF